MGLSMSFEFFYKCPDPECKTGYVLIKVWDSQVAGLTWILSQKCDHCGLTTKGLLKMTATWDNEPLRDHLRNWFRDVDKEACRRAA